MKSTAKNTIILFITLTIIMMGFGMVIPVFPFLIEEFGASGSELGLLMSIYALMQFIFSPMWGEISDRIGRRPVMLIGLIGNGLSMLFMGLSTDLWMLFVARALAGLLSSATMPTALAYVGDTTTNENRSAGMGKLSAALSLGMVIGPGISGLLAEDSLSLPFFVGAGLSLFAVAVVFFFLPESLAKENRSTAITLNFKQQFSSMWTALRGPVGFLLFLAFLVSFGLTNFEGVFGLFMKDVFHYSPARVGSLLMVIGLISAIVQGFLTGIVTKRWGETVVIKVTLLSSAIGFVLMLTAFNLITNILTVGFFVFSNAMIRPGVSALTSKRSGPEEQGKAMGLNNSFMSLGRVIGPALAGMLYDVNMSLPYMIGGGITLLGFFLCLFLLKAPQRQPQAVPVE